MPRRPILLSSALLLLVAAAVAAGVSALVRAEADVHARAARAGRGEGELRVANPGAARLALFRAGRDLDGAVPVPVESFASAWLPAGRYFLEASGADTRLRFPVAVDAERGTLDLAVRPVPPAAPPAGDGPGYVWIPSGPFELGDRRNPGEVHEVWLPGFFLGSFEATNGEFRRFLADPGGYDERANWTDAGWAWRGRGTSRATARLAPGDPAYARFGRDPLPVVLVTWFEADAYCRWLTRRAEGGRLWYRLPTEAEWEKAARGPDGFDYGLGMELSEAEAPLYNWKKNPHADPTLVGADVTPRQYRPNRYGLYHMSGNAAEWTASLRRAFRRGLPYREDERNDREAEGQRVTRGGSWYSAANVRLYLAYREEFQPEMSSDDLGFRVAAVPMPGPLR